MRALVACVALFACKSDTPPKTPVVAAPRIDDADALWALAPPGTTVGNVVTPHGLVELERAFVRVRRQLAASPELADISALLEMTLHSRLPHFEHLSDLGFTTARGLAMFTTHDGGLFVMPVADRDKFIATFHGRRGDTDQIGNVTCKPIDGRYTCASNPAMFALEGKAPMQGTLDRAGGRGDVEIYVGADALATPGLTSVRIAVALDDGVLDAHAFVEGRIAQVTPFFAAKPLPPDDHPGSFALANIAPVLDKVPPVSFGAVSADQLARSMTGSLAATVSSSSLAFRLRAPLVDPAPWTTLLASCDLFGGLAGVPMHTQNGACHVELPGALAAISFDVWVEDRELRIGSKKGPLPVGKVDAMTPIAHELASWPFALWGRGSVYAAHLATTFGAALDPKVVPGLAVALRLGSQISELGLAGRATVDGLQLRAYLRTIWANPREVADQIAAISPADAIAGRSDARALAIAAANPKSPFAADLSAGPAGMLLPVAALGTLASVAVPAFLDSLKKTKTPSSVRELNRLSANAKKIYAETGAFPKGMAPLTPATTCCVGPKGRCVWSDADKAQPVWQALDFVQEPGLFQYSYASDGTSFNATAVGDLDCDGTMITYTLSGTIENGAPKTMLTEPAPNSD
jgi:hypothetical protein